MTPAEFKATREALGLSSQWLADRWGAALHSVQRWERSRTLPAELARDFESIEDAFRDEVASGIADAAASLDIPRVNADSPDGFPAAYHRAVALRIAEATGARLVFLSES